MEYQYDLTSSLAAIIVGACVTPAIAAGTMLGGYIAKKLRLDPPGAIMLYLICQCIAVPMSLTFLLTCPNAEYCGVNSQCETTVSTNDNYTYSCNVDCSCSELIYDPVCGSDNRQYYNPCFAGCQYSPGEDEYDQCLCINDDWGTAVAEPCKVECKVSVGVVGLCIFVYVFFTFTAYMPNLIAIMKSVEPVHRSLALGIESIVRRYRNFIFF